MFQITFKFGSEVGFEMLQTQHFFNARPELGELFKRQWIQKSIFRKIKNFMNFFVFWETKTIQTFFRKTG